MRLAVALLLSLSGLAHPDDDAEPAVTHAGEANLDPKGSRTNIQFTGAIGGAVSLGFSMTDANGSGGALSLRLGEPMTPEWVLNFEIGSVTQPHRAFDKTLELDNSTALLVGASYYLSNAFFLRGAIGVGNYVKKNPTIMGDPTSGDHHYGGFATAFGFGLDIIRVKHFVFGTEIWNMSLLNRDGLLSSTAFCVAMTVN